MVFGLIDNIETKFYIEIPLGKGQLLFSNDLIKEFLQSNSDLIFENLELSKEEKEICFGHKKTEFNELYNSYYNDLEPEFIDISHEDFILIDEKVKNMFLAKVIETISKSLSLLESELTYD